MSTTARSSFVVSNQRTANRLPTFLEAQLLIRSGKNVECIVWDMTDRGAKIGVDHEIALPLYFDLYIPAQNVLLSCEGRWRTTEFVGVRFLMDKVRAASLPR